MRMLMFTPETSGGLLIALPPEELGPFQDRCAAVEQPVWVVGDVLDGEGLVVV
jgi:selenide,water dikinase